MAEALGGLAQGLAQGLGQVNNAVDRMEEIKRNRDNMRLKMQQEARMQETHDANMQQMAEQLKALRRDNFKRKLIDEVEAMDNGWADGFSPELMADPFFQETFRDFNIRPASYFGQDVLTKQGINDDEKGDWYIGTNGKGEYVKTGRDIFHQMTGYQSRLNKRAKESAETLSKQTAAMKDQMVKQNLEELTPIYDQVKAIIEEKIFDPNTAPEDLVGYVGALEQLAQYKAGGLAGKGDVSFAMQQAAAVKETLGKFRSLDYTDEDLDNAHGLSSQFSRVADSASDYLGDTVNNELKQLGIQPTAALDISKLDPKLQRAIKDRAAFAKRGKIGDRVVKTLQEFSGNESISYGLQIAEMASKALKGGPKFKRDMFQTTTNNILRKAPDGIFGDWKNENLTDSQFNVLAQLYINAYGNEKFGSALTETEAAKIDAVFGSGWDNTQQFLKGLSATMYGTYHKMLSAAKGDPLLAAQMFGDQFIGLENAIKNLDSYSRELTNYAAWVQKQQKAGKKDLTYKTYEKELNSSPTQMQPLNPSQSTMPEDEEFKRAMQLTEGANLFGGAK